MRLFFALDVDDAQREAMRAVITQLRAISGRSVRWGDPQSAHITLVFLGEVAAGRVEELLAVAGQALAGCPAPTLQLNAIGAFPSLRRPQTIWLGLKSGLVPAAAEHKMHSPEATALDAHDEPGIQPSTGVADRVERLVEVQRRLAAALEPLGFPREQRAYWPHLTLGRVRREASAAELRSLTEALEQLAAPRPLPWRASAVQLYQSELTTGGAQYTQIGSLPLAADPS